MGQLPTAGLTVGAACTARIQANLKGVYFLPFLIHAGFEKPACLLLSSRPENQRPCELRNKGRWMRWGLPSLLNLSNIEEAKSHLGWVCKGGGVDPIRLLSQPEHHTHHSHLACINLPALPASLLISAPVQMRCGRRHSVDAGGSSLCIPATTAACDLRLGS